MSFSILNCFIICLKWYCTGDGNLSTMSHIDEPSSSVFRYIFGDRFVGSNVNFSVCHEYSDYSNGMYLCLVSYVLFN